MTSPYPLGLDNLQTNHTDAGTEHVLAATTNAHATAINALEKRAGVGASTPIAGNVLIGTGTGLTEWRSSGAFNVTAKGATGDGSTDDGPAIAAAEAASGSAALLFPPGIYVIGSNITLADVIMVPGARLAPGVGVTVTIQTTITAPRRQIFSGPGIIAFGFSFVSQNMELYSCWWGDKMVTVPAPTAAPVLTLRPDSWGGGGQYINGSTYDFAFTYEGWSGETMLGPSTTVTVLQNERFVVLPRAPLSTVATAARIYGQKDGGGYKLYNHGFGAARCGFGDETMFGGVWAIPGGALLTPPPGSNTALDVSNSTIANPTLAPTVTRVGGLPPSTTFYCAFSYVGQDGTETALSPVSNSVTTLPMPSGLYGCYVTARVPHEPPVGAVFVNWYLGTSPTTLHLQLSHMPLHHAAQDIHLYNASGSAAVVGAPQSTISGLQQALDAAYAGGSLAVTVPPGQYSTFVPLIFRGPTPGMRLRGLGGHADPGSGTGDSVVTYRGTLTGVEVIVFFGVSWTIENIDFYGAGTSAKYGLAFCDFTMGESFSSRFVNCTFYVNGANSTAMIVDARSGAFLLNHTASEMYFDTCSFWGNAWGIHLGGANASDFRFKDCVTQSQGNGGSANSGDVRLFATGGDYFRGHNSNGKGQYLLYMGTDGGADPGGSQSGPYIECDTFLAEALTIAQQFYVSAVVTNVSHLHIRNSWVSAFGPRALGAYAGGPCQITYESNFDIETDVLLVHPDATFLELGGQSGFQSYAFYKSVGPASQVYPPVRIRNGPLSLNGQNIYMVTGVPSNSLGSNGDFAYRSDGTAAGHTLTYHKEAGAWAAAS